MTRGRAILSALCVGGTAVCTGLLLLGAIGAVPAGDMLPLLPAAVALPLAAEALAQPG